MKEGECEVVRSLHVPGRRLFLPVSVREELGEGGREGGWEDGRMGGWKENSEGGHK